MSPKTKARVNLVINLLFVAASLVAGWAWERRASWRGGPAIAEPPPVVEIAQPTRRARKAKRQPAPPAICTGLTEIADAELLAEIARRHQLPDLTPGVQSFSSGSGGELAAAELRRSLLALEQTETPARWGVEIAATLAPGETSPRLTVVPRPPPGFAWSRRFRLEGGAGPAVTIDGFGAGAESSLAGWGKASTYLAQTRRAEHGVSLAVFHAGDATTILGGYELAAEWP